MASHLSSLVLQIGHQIPRLNEDLQDEISETDRIRFLRAELRPDLQDRILLTGSATHVQSSPETEDAIYRKSLNPSLMRSDPVYGCLLDEIQSLLQFDPGDRMTREVRVIVHGSLDAAEDRSCFLRILQYLGAVLGNFSANIVRLVPVIPFASRNSPRFFDHLHSIDARFRQMGTMYSDELAVSKPEANESMPSEGSEHGYPPYLTRVLLISDDLGGQIMNPDELSSFLFLSLRLLCEPRNFVSRYRMQSDAGQTESLAEWLKHDDILHPIGEVVDPWSGPYTSIGFIHYGIDVKRINRVMKLYLYHLLIEQLAQPELVEGQYVFQKADNELEQLIL
ncbi:MAG: hypothetical protein KDK37_14110, partial [Leptospiraceae bacterium]|nr:hypothetical protein [Leptospiraceae bacterium]